MRGSGKRPFERGRGRERGRSRIRRRPPQAFALAAATATAILGCRDPVAPAAIRAALDARAPLSIVLVVVDTLRADWTTPYSAAERASPELQRWAQHGVVFERTVSQSSWTKASMASLMTSLWPRRHGVRATDDGLAGGALTVAEVFQRAGYATFAVQSNGWLEQTFGFHQGFDHYMFPRGGLALGAKPMVWPHADNVYLEAERLIERSEPERPFFLYLHFMDVHEYASPADIGDFGPGTEGAYRASIHWVDEVIARLREKLASVGRLDETVLVLTSDHGEAFGENGVHGHARDVHAQVLRVPLIVRLPFAVTPVRVASQVRNLDVAPTLLDLAGLPVPASFQGSSLVPLMADPTAARDRPSYASLPALLFQDAQLQDGVDDGSWSFIRNADPEAREFLYDLTVDPGEHVNLVDIDTAAAARMRALLDAHLSEPADPAAVEPNVRINPALAEKLRALGYGT